MIEKLSLVSILVPNYNKALYLRESLNSVLTQTYSNWECIIVDDHSTDESWKILVEYAQIDKRFKINRRPEELPKGGNVCRNFALNHSQGDYILFLDSDDVLAPFCLDQRIKEIQEHENLDFWAFPTALFEEEVSDAKYLWNIDGVKDSDLSRFLRMDALWQTSGSIYRKEFLIKVNGLSNDRKFWQDFELHLKALFYTKNYKKFFELPPDVFIRNGDKSSLSRSTPFVGDLKILKGRIDFLDQIESFAKFRNFQFTLEEKHSLFSFKYYLILQLWIKHGEFSLFIKKWRIYSKQNNLSFPLFLKGFMEAINLKLSNRLSRINTKNIKRKSFDFPDFRILDHIQIGKHPIRPLNY